MDFGQICFAVHILVLSKHIANKNGRFPYKLLKYKLYGNDRENSQISPIWSKALNAVGRSNYQ